MGNGKKDNLKEPVAKCAKDLGALVTEVMTYKSLFPRSKREALPGVKVKIGGTTKKDDQTTGAKGRAPVFSGLEPGAYAVSLEFTPAMTELYDVDGSTTTDTKDVKKGKTTVYPFEVPWFWVEHQVQYPDAKTFVPGIEYVLRHQKPDPPDSPWTQRSTGTTGLKKVIAEKVPRGRYKLDLKLVYDPVWGDPQVEIDKAIEIKATVSGFDPGMNGTIEIVDAHALTPALLTLDATVAETVDKSKRELKTTWTPTKVQLKDLKCGKIAFRAVVGNSFVFSAPEPVFIKEKYQVVDDDGNKLDTRIELRFSGGRIESKAVVGGEVDVLVPWNESIARVDLPDHKGKRVSLDEGTVTGRRFLMPA
jgi:hypothetical protein